MFNRLSVICQLWCEVRNKFLIPGKAFLPKPDVDVGVVTLKPLKYPLTDVPFKMAEKILRNIFNMRQKYSFKGASRLFPEDIRDELGNYNYLDNPQKLLILNASYFNFPYFIM